MCTGEAASFNVTKVWAVHRQINGTVICYDISMYKYIHQTRYFLGKFGSMELAELAACNLDVER